MQDKKKRVIITRFRKGGDNGYQGRKLINANSGTVYELVSLTGQGRETGTFTAATVARYGV